LSGWLARRAASEAPAPLRTESEVGWVEGEPLSAIAGALSAGGASVRAAYPGVWLTARAWATHGHYLDVHTTVPKLERLSAGAMARLEGRPSTKVEAA